MDEGDIIIDGGNTYYRDDIDRAEALAAEGRPLRRRRHERRRVRPRARLLPDDRRRGRRRSRTSTRSSAPSPPVSATSSARPGATANRRRPRWATCTAARRCGPLREDGAQRHRVRADGGVRRGSQRPCTTPTSGKADHKVDAETTPLRDPKYYQYDIDTARGRRGVAARVGRRVVAARPHRRRARRRPRRSRRSRAASVDSGEGRWTSIAAIDEGAPAPVLTTALYGGSPRAAKPTSPTSCSRPCASSSAATTRSTADAGLCRHASTPSAECPRRRCRRATTPRPSSPSSGCSACRCAGAARSC